MTTTQGSQVDTTRTGASPAAAVSTTDARDRAWEAAVYGLAASLAPTPSPAPGTAITRRFDATLAAINPTSPPTLDLNLNGSLIPGVRYVASYLPSAVGDPVIVDFLGTDPLVVGSQTRASGSIVAEWLAGGFNYSTGTSYRGTAWRAIGNGLTPITIRKTYPDSKIRVRLDVTSYATVAIGLVYYGLQDPNGTVTASARYYHNTLSDHRTITGMTDLTGLQAGQYTWTPVISTDGNTQWNVDANDFYALTLTEVNP